MRSTVQSLGNCFYLCLGCIAQQPTEPRGCLGIDHVEKLEQPLLTNLTQPRCQNAKAVCATHAGAALLYPDFHISRKPLANGIQPHRRSHTTPPTMPMTITAIEIEILQLRDETNKRTKALIAMDKSRHA